MALDAALKIVGQAQGAIRGLLTGPSGHEGEIRVAALDHLLVSPRDAATGQATGRRVHGELTVTKELDPSTPKLLSAWVRNEKLTTWKLDLLGVDAAGRSVVAYTIELVDAAVSRVELVMPSTFDPASRNVPAHEKVSFVYAGITWTWGTSVTASDRWADAT
jgi:type VI secretion system secreted protein Hcp